MATIHPSRLGLVPQAPPPRPRSPTPPPLTREEELRRRLLEKRKTKDESNEPSGSRSQSGEVDGGQHSRTTAGLKIKGSSKLEREGSPVPDVHHSSPRRTRERDMSPRPPARANYDRDRDAPPRRQDEKWTGRVEDRSRSRERDRRPSPSYAPRPDDRQRERDYGYSDRRGDLRPPPGPPYGRPEHWPPFPPKSGYPPMPGPGQAPPNAPAGNGYGAPPPPPMRMGFDRPGGNGYGGSGGYGGGKLDFERRRLEREENPLSIWPPSPKRPYREEDDVDEGKSKKKSKKSKSKRRKRYSDESDSTDTEEERERRRRRKKDKERRRRYEEDERSESEAEERRRMRRRRHSSEDRDRSKSRRAGSRTRSESPEKKDWIEKDKEGAATQSAMAGQGIDTDSEDDGDAVGPQLPAEHKDRARRQQFKDMLPGEAAAMAAFASSGQRIPRRGEIGLDANKIEEFEASGFVMSGNRHKRMNAVRLRKENQVISAEEKRAILNLQKEERMKKEGAIISQFKELLDDNWRSQGLKDGHHE